MRSTRRRLLAVPARWKNARFTAASGGDIPRLHPAIIQRVAPARRHSTPDPAALPTWPFRRSYIAPVISAATYEQLLNTPPLQVSAGWFAGVRSAQGGRRRAAGAELRDDDRRGP